MRVVNNLEELRQLYLTLRKQRIVAFDTETYGRTQLWKKHKNSRSFIDALTAQTAIISLAWAGEAAVIPLPVMNAGGDLTDDNVASFVRALLKTDCILVAHNLVYDYLVLWNLIGEEPRRPVDKYCDTMLIAWLENQGVWKMRAGELKQSFGLKDVAKKHLGMEMTEFKDLPGGGMKLVGGPSDKEIVDNIFIDLQTRGGFTPKEMLAKIRQVAKYTQADIKRQVWVEAQVPDYAFDSLVKYAADDAVAALKLYEKLPREVATPKVLSVEIGTVFTLANMYRAGIRVSEEKIQEIKTVVNGELAKVKNEWKELGRTESISSGQQVGAAIAAMCPGWPLTEKGKPKTDKGTFNEALRDPNTPDEAKRLISILLKHSQLAKIAGTYTNSLIDQIPYRDDKRLRCDLHQTGTDTGRFSSSGPNMQNLPRPSKDVINIREAIVPAPGYVLCAVDMSQFEIAIMAHYSGDKALRGVVVEGLSMHDITAAAMGIPRHQAKVYNLALNYGAGAKKIAIQLGIPLVKRFSKRKNEWIWCAPKEVQRNVDVYKETYSGVTAFKEKIAAFAREHGYVETILGRRRYLPDAKSEDMVTRWHAERQASNTPIQGSAADIIKIAANACLEYLRDTRQGSIIMQVHDELVFEIREEEAATTSQNLTKIMETAHERYFTLDVPLRADCKLGKHWAECK